MMLNAKPWHIWAYFSGIAFCLLIFALLLRHIWTMPEP